MIATRSFCAARVPHATGIVLETIVATLAPLAGKPFVEALVARLTDVLGVSYAFVAQRARGNPAIANTIAVAHKGGPVADLIYPLEGTPCGDVLTGGVCEMAEAVQAAFPGDAALVEMHVESYVGVLLTKDGGGPLGWLAVMHGAPLADTRRITDLLMALGPRLAVELERMEIERVLTECQSAMAQRLSEQTEELEAAQLALGRAEAMLREEGLNPPPRERPGHDERLHDLTIGLAS